MKSIEETGNKIARSVRSAKVKKGNSKGKKQGGGKHLSGPSSFNSQVQTWHAEQYYRTGIIAVVSVFGEGQSTFEEEEENGRLSS